MTTLKLSNNQIEIPIPKEKPLRELEELTQTEAFIVIDELEEETDKCYMNAWNRIEKEYMFDENLNAIKKA